MSQVSLNIKLLDITQNAISVIYVACRQCYSSEFADDLIKERRDDRKREEFIKRVVESGHESPLEHVKLTFAMEGVSRTLTHQLVRHRIASYSQQSGRYVKETDFDYIIPPSIEKDKKVKSEFIRIMAGAQNSYNKILELLKERGIVGEKANQDARFVLPQGAETKIIVTMNCRELIHFFKQRCCARAQWEIRNLADKMLSICRERLSSVFSQAGAKCISLEYCPEGKNFTCGRYLLKEEAVGGKK